MAKVVIEDPELVRTVNVDANGKIHIGKKYAGMEAKIIIEEFSKPREDE